MSPKPSIIFFGTPDFAVPALNKLINADFDIKAVITRPDKPVGRKQVITPPPVKILAQENSIPVFQPIKISDEFIGQIKDLNPDVFVIVAYGKILPQTLLDIPKKGSLNIHPSLLPKYRGPSPLQATLLGDDSQAGVCIMLIDEEMDHGPILKKIEYPLTGKEDYESLGNTLFEIGAGELPSVLIEYLSGKITPETQDHDLATYTKLIKKEDGQIDWSKPAEYIEKMIRAYSPWPGVYGTFNLGDKQIEAKIIKAAVSEKSSAGKAGLLFKTDDQQLAVICGEDTVLAIEEIQPTGKAKMKASAFSAGYLK